MRVFTLLVFALAAGGCPRPPEPPSPDSDAFAPPEAGLDSPDPVDDSTSPVDSAGGDPVVAACMTLHLAGCKEGGPLCAGAVNNALAHPGISAKVTEASVRCVAAAKPYSMTAITACGMDCTP